MAQLDLLVHLANLVYLVMMAKMVIQAALPDLLVQRVTLVKLVSLDPMEKWDQLVNQVRSA